MKRSSGSPKVHESFINVIPLFTRCNLINIAFLIHIFYWFRLKASSDIFVKEKIRKRSEKNFDDKVKTISLLGLVNNCF